MEVVVFKVVVVVVVVIERKIPYRRE